VGRGTVEIEFLPSRDLTSIPESALAGFIKDLQEKIYTDHNHEDH